jgi:hypothetical protein
MYICLYRLVNSSYLLDFVVWNSIFYMEFQGHSQQALEQDARTHEIPVEPAPAVFIIISHHRVLRLLRLTKEGFDITYYS